MSKAKELVLKLKNKITPSIAFCLFEAAFMFFINCVTAIIRDYNSEIDVFLGIGIGFLFAMAIFCLVMVGIIIKRKEIISVSAVTLGLTLALGTYFFQETVISGYALKHKVVFTLFAFAFVYLFYLPGGFLFKKSKFIKGYYIAITFILSFYGVAQYFVFAFRGAPIRASDFNNIVSAMEISSEYPLASGLGLAILIFGLLYMATAVYSVVRCEVIDTKPKTRIGVGCVFVSFILLFSFVNSKLLEYGVENRIILFNYNGTQDMTSYQGTGNALLLYLDLMNSESPKPDEYTDEKAKNILSQYVSEDEKGERKPTVIAILSESLAEFKKLGDFETNKDYLPFYNSLTENTVKGSVSVSAYGGYSCNSEFEFLTGNTMHFYPLGSAAYTQYVKKPQDSLVNYFDNRGYKTVSMSLFSEDLWNTKNVYDRLGFETQFYGRNYDWETIELINDNISDKTMFEGIINYYEKNSGDAPMFLFASTAQNHSPYKPSDKDEIKLENMDNEKAEAYLSGVYESDKALEMLINYFSNVDEEVVVVLFGDHYPHIPDFSEELLGDGLGNLSVERNAALHSTPYLVWANYDIEEKEEDISLNYLSNTLLEVCDAPKTDFHLFLDDMKAEIPEISAIGFKGKDGKWHRRDEKDGYEELIYNYSLVQYYRVFEKYSD